MKSVQNYAKEGVRSCMAFLCLYQHEINNSLRCPRILGHIRRHQSLSQDLPSRGFHLCQDPLFMDWLERNICCTPIFDAQNPWVSGHFCSLPPIPLMVLYIQQVPEGIQQAMAIASNSLALLWRNMMASTPWSATSLGQLMKN